ncbi:MAG: TIR domain-containing protein, partial [Verrucomicrobia bacterium]|nr:TIR domain-containing protein [Verrucomicrobiota bacterium]
MPTLSSAIFLSYARKDTNAARRIADALRGFGVEVWFDQSELRGGDTWDQKIRGQIKSCALFLPVISQHTQARGEGYFRLEWKLAAERTHLMAEGVPFLAPVVVDDTPDSAAAVPAEFLRVQWTRLSGGMPTPQFVEQIKRLLAAPRTAAPASAVGAPLDGARSGTASRFPSDSGAEAAPLRRPATPLRKPRLPGWIWATIAALVLVAGAAAFFALRPARKETVASTPAPKPATQPSKPLDLAAAKSIAVLPFANLSADKENEFFADGMHDELLTALSKIGDLKVISRTSVLAYRDPAKRNLKQIATELGVAHVLEGSVSRAGSRVRIIVQLIDAATDHHLWAETYNKDVTDVFQVQADISALIARSLAATLSPEQKLALAHKLTSNPAAYDLYLRARRWREMNRGTELNTTAKWEEVVVRPLEQSVALDPKFAAAYAELGRVHGEIYWWPQLDPTPARLAKAKEAVDTALRLEPALPVAHLALGTYHYLGFLDFARATEEYAIALAAMPGDADVLFGLATTQRRQGRWAEATAIAERAFAVNPRNSDIALTWVQCLHAQRFFARAERAAEQALALLDQAM